MVDKAAPMKNLLQIETIQGDTRASIEAINEISTIINKVNDIQATIATAVEQQTADGEPAEAIQIMD